MCPPKEDTDKDATDAGTEVISMYRSCSCKRQQVVAFIDNGAVRVGLVVSVYRGAIKSNVGAHEAAANTRRNRVVRPHPYCLPARLCRALDIKPLTQHSTNNLQFGATTWSDHNTGSNRVGPF